MHNTHNVRVSVVTAAGGLGAAIATVDLTPFRPKYGDDTWAAVKTYQDAQAAYAAAPVIKKYTGVPAAVDVYTTSTA